MIFIFDIDGTLANVEHRRIYIANKPKNWNAWNAGMHLDTPNETIVTLLKCIAKSAEHKVVICSGRGEEHREVTEKWLFDNQIYFGVDYQKLYMRPAKDNRKDSIVKLELLEQMRKDGYDPVLAFDDRNQVVDAWRSAGLVCCQVAPGDF